LPSAPEATLLAGALGGGERYRLLFECADDAMLCSDLEGRIIDANPAAERLTGYSRSELIGQRARDRLVAPEWHDVARCRLARRLEELTPHQLYEVVFLDRAGIRKPVEASSTLVYQDGELVGFVSIIRDVSERKRAEAALLESEERFRQAFEHAAIGMAVCAPSGHYLQVNQALCDLVGYTRDELLGKAFQYVTHPGDLELDLDYARKLYSGELNRYEMEKRFIRKDGSTTWVLLTRSVVRDAQGVPVYALGQMQDITDRKRVESQRSSLLVEHPDVRPLSHRERQLLTLAADGNTNEQIATQLEISPDTAQTHMRRAMRKLNAGTRTQAVATALRLDLI
jgi:PAS domain S-box-containing protein